MFNVILLLFTTELALSSVDSMFHREEKIHNLPPNLLKAICYVETGHNLKLRYKFDVYSNSYGICQVKIGAARQMGFTHPEKLLAQPDVNARIAAKYLQYQLKRYNGDVKKAITAYNRGSFKPNYNLNNKYVAKVYQAWETL